MTTEAKITLFGSIACAAIIVMIAAATPTPNPAKQEAICRAGLALNTDRSLDEIQILCKQR